MIFTQSTDEFQLSLETWLKLLRKVQTYVLNNDLFVKLIQVKKNKDN